MRFLATLFPLFFCGCAAFPTEEDVAGIYEPVSVDGAAVVLLEGERMSIELTKTGTWNATSIDARWAAPSTDQGFFSVEKGDGGCVLVHTWRKEAPEEKQASTICGDQWGWSDSAWELEVIYRKRSG